jgi:hypothetical protein
MRPQLFLPGLLVALSQRIAAVSAAGPCEYASETPTSQGFSAWKFAFGVFGGLEVDKVRLPRKPSKYLSS